MKIPYRNWTHEMKLKLIGKKLTLEQKIKFSNVYKKKA